MTSPFESDVRRGLAELADAPAPPDLAGVALCRARTVRRRRAALAGTGALALAGVLAVPLLNYGGPARAGNPGAATSATDADAIRRAARSRMAIVSPGPQSLIIVDSGCTPGSRVDPTVKEVAPGNWPEFVRVAVGRLPARSDYVLRSAYGVCVPDGAAPLVRASTAPATSAPAGAAGGASGTAPPVANAYAVITLGHGGEHGHLTISLYATTSPQLVPRTCAAVRAMVQRRPPTPEPARTMGWCGEMAGDVQIAFTTEYEGAFITTAVHRDGRTVTVESWGEGNAEPTIGPDQLEPVVTDTALADLLLAR